MTTKASKKARSACEKRITSIEKNFQKQSKLISELEKEEKELGKAARDLKTAQSLRTGLAKKIRSLQGKIMTIKKKNKKAVAEVYKIKKSIAQTAIDAEVIEEELMREFQSKATPKKATKTKQQRKQATPVTRRLELGPTKKRIPAQRPKSTRKKRPTLKVLENQNMQKERDAQKKMDSRRAKLAAWKRKKKALLERNKR